jgi:hypothetical protein
MDGNTFVASTNLLANLVDDILLSILEYLPKASLIRTAAVSQPSHTLSLYDLSIRYIKTADYDLSLFDPLSMTDVRELVRNQYRFMKQILEKPELRDHVRSFR